MNKRQAKKRKKFIIQKYQCAYPTLVKGWSEIRWERQWVKQRLTR